MKLLTEQSYDSITVQDIVEQANVGRTTFYDHYDSKEDLFLDSHHQIAHQLSSMMTSEEDVLTPEPSAGISVFLEELLRNRTVYLMMRRGPAWPEIAQGLHEQMASHLLDNLRQAFGEAQSDVSLDLLANYVTAAQFGFITWWLEARAPYSPEEIARIAHSMRRAAIREALHL